MADYDGADYDGTQPDSEPDHDNDDTRDETMEDNPLVYGTQTKKDCQPQEGWGPFWDQWAQPTDDALEAGWGPSSSGASPPPPLPPNAGDKWAMYFPHKLPPTPFLQRIVPPTHWRALWTRDESFQPPLMICHMCRETQKLDRLIDHIETAHEPDDSTRLIIDNVGNSSAPNALDQ